MLERFTDEQILQYHEDQPVPGRREPLDMDGVSEVGDSGSLWVCDHPWGTDAMAVAQVAGLVRSWSGGGGSANPSAADCDAK